MTPTSSADRSAIPPELKQKVRALLGEHTRLAVGVHHLADDEDLYAAGMTSQASVNMMLAIEDEFSVEFPDEMLRRSTFGSIDAICAAVAQLIEA